MITDRSDGGVSREYGERNRAAKLSSHTQTILRERCQVATYRSYAHRRIGRGQSYNTGVPCKVSRAVGVLIQFEKGAEMDLWYQISELCNGNGTTGYILAMAG